MSSTPPSPVAANKRPVDEASEPDAKKRTVDATARPEPPKPYKPETLRAMLQDRIWKQQQAEREAARAFVDAHAYEICKRLTDVSAWEVSDECARSAEVDLCACPADIADQIVAELEDDYTGYIFGLRDIPLTDNYMLKAVLPELRKR